MNIHEYQAKEILSKFGVSIPKGGLAYSPENAKDRATELGIQRQPQPAEPAYSDGDQGRQDARDGLH